MHRSAIAQLAVHAITEAVAGYTRTLVQTAHSIKCQPGDDTATQRCTGILQCLSDVEHDTATMDALPCLKVLRDNVWSLLKQMVMTADRAALAQSKSGQQILQAVLGLATTTARRQQQLSKKHAYTRNINTMEATLEGITWGDWTPDIREPANDGAAASYPHNLMHDAAPPQQSAQTPFAAAHQDLSHQNLVHMLSLELTRATVSSLWPYKIVQRDQLAHLAATEQLLKELLSAAAKPPQLEGLATLLADVWDSGHAWQQEAWQVRVTL